MARIAQAFFFGAWSEMLNADEIGRIRAWLVPLLAIRYLHCMLLLAASEHLMVLPSVNGGW